MASHTSQLPPWRDDELIDRRIVMLVGLLDDAVALRVSAELMTLDATGTEPIQLRFGGSGDRLGPALMVIDTLDVLGAPSHAHAQSDVSGTLVAVFACCGRRTAAPHSAFQLREPLAHLATSPRNISTNVVQETNLLDRFRARLARAVDRTPAEVADDLQRSRYLDATEALRYGLLTRDPDQAGPRDQRSHE